MTTEAPAAPSALSQLKIDRSVQAKAKKRSMWPVAVGALLVAGAAAWFLVPRSADVSATNAVMSTPSQQFVQLTASGYVVAQRRSAVASKASGRLIELNVREGSKVKKDDVLARLDASDIRAGMAAAEAAIHQAEANVRQSMVQLINARSELARARSLETQGFISAQMVDTALARNKAAFAANKAAEAVEEQARAQYRAQQVALAYTEIRAPFDGVVLNKNANIGDMVTPMSSAAGAQGAVVTMADMSTLEVEADVSESNLAKTKVGQPVEITLDALPGVRFKGHVAGIVPTVDRAKATVMTKIRFDKLDPRILPEMSAKVSFLSQEITDADQQPVLAVAKSSVLKRDNGGVVFRIVGQQKNAATVEEIAIKTGRTLGDLMEVTGGGLKSGDKIVANPPATLKNGGRINLGAS
ncbi:MAG: hypothetical protein RI907_3161 [Pseudomonadota bacterium]|jgi:RND family efflux transporter MFP subunit